MLVTIYSLHIAQPGRPSWWYIIDHRNHTCTHRYPALPAHANNQYPCPLRTPENPSHLFPQAMSSHPKHNRPNPLQRQNSPQQLHPPQRPPHTLARAHHKRNTTSRSRRRGQIRPIRNNGRAVLPVPLHARLDVRRLRCVSGRRYDHCSGLLFRRVVCGGRLLVVGCCFGRGLVGGVPGGGFVAAAAADGAAAGLARGAAADLVVGGVLADGVGGAAAGRSC